MIPANRLTSLRRTWTAARQASQVARRAFLCDGLRAATASNLDHLRAADRFAVEARHSLREALKAELGIKEEGERF